MIAQKRLKRIRTLLFIAMDDPKLFPMILYREYKSGLTVEHLSLLFGIPEHWIEQHLEAASLCYEKQVVITADGDDTSKELVYP